PRPGPALPAGIVGAAPLPATDAPSKIHRRPSRSASPFLPDCPDLASSGRSWTLRTVAAAPAGPALCTQVQNLLSVMKTNEMAQRLHLEAVASGRGVLARREGT